MEFNELVLISLLSRAQARARRRAAELAPAPGHFDSVLFGGGCKRLGGGSCRPMRLGLNSVCPWRIRITRISLASMPGRGNPGFSRQAGVLAVPLAVVSPAPHVVKIQPRRAAR